MKKIIILTFLIVLFFTSCAERELEVTYTVTSQNTTTNDEENEIDEEVIVPPNEKSIIIGDSVICGTSINSFVPSKYNGFGSNSWSAVIYTASDLQNNSGSIKTLSYIIDCKYYDCEANPVIDQKIYFKEISNTNFTNAIYPDVNSMTLVYEGSISWKRATTIENGWTEILLDTPFNYNGVSNLMIYYENNNNNSVGGILSCVGETPSFLWDYRGENRSLQATYNITPNITATTPYIDNITPITKFTF